MNRFEDRRVLITGGAGSIGRAIAERVMIEGGEVHIWDVDTRGGSDFAQQAASKGLRCRFHEVDMNEPERVKQAADVFLGEHNTLEVLINAAGGALAQPYAFRDLDDTDWDAVIRLNLMSAVRTTRCFIGAMIESGYGRILNVGSKAGRYGSLIDGASYVAAKGALHALTLSWAMEYGPSGITCNAVAPGMIMNERVRGLWAQRRPAAEREAIRLSIPLGRHGEPADVAGVAAFLCSDDARFVTGTVLDINGGQSMSV